jgi:hypothetical protein
MALVAGSTVSASFVDPSNDYLSDRGIQIPV